MALPGRRIQDVFSLAEEQIKAAAVILFHVGTNNVGTNEDPDQILFQYRSLLNATQRANPMARLVVTAVLPRHSSKFNAASEDYLRLNAVAEEVNALLPGLCAELRVCFCSFWTSFLNRGFISRDGLHLSPSGVAFLRSAYSSHAPKISSRSGCAPGFTLAPNEFPELPNSAAVPLTSPRPWPAPRLAPNRVGVGRTSLLQVPRRKDVSPVLPLPGGDRHRDLFHCDVSRSRRHHAGSRSTTDSKQLASAPSLKRLKSGGT